MEQQNATPLPSVGAPRGNDNNVKYKTPEERQQIVDAYCAHLEAGYMKESFPDCDYRTVENVAKIDLKTEKVEEAERKGMKFWENVGRNGTLGIPTQYKDKDGKFQVSSGFNSTSWIFIVKNKLRWTDRQDIVSDGQPIKLNIVGGGYTGYIPESRPPDAPSAGSDMGSPSVQSTGVAPESTKDIHINSGAGETSVT